MRKSDYEQIMSIIWRINDDVLVPEVTLYSRNKRFLRKSTPTYHSLSTSIWHGITLIAGIFVRGLEYVLTLSKYLQILKLYIVKYKTTYINSNLLLFFANKSVIYYTF